MTGVATQDVATAPAATAQGSVAAGIEFRVDPKTYKHWRVEVDGPVAAVIMDVDEQGGLVPGYELKLNSYDLGVDIELYDAVQRLRFEHPEVRTVVLTSAKDKIFCAGANIRMLAGSAAPVEGELLQVHQRDPQRHRGRHRELRPDLPRRAERHGVRRRVRAGAGVRAHHAGRRPLVRGRRCPSCRCSACCRAPAGSPASSTSGTSAATWPTTSPPRPRASAARRRSSGGWSTRSCRAPKWAETVAARARASSRRARIARPTRRASR